MSDALFGVDGTELPELLPDPSGRGGWRDGPEFPPLTLPAVPDISALREAMAGSLDEDPAEPVDQDSSAAPAPQPDAPQNVAPSALPSNVPQANAPQQTTTAPPPDLPAPQAGGVPMVAVPGHRPWQPLVPAPVQPAKPPPRKAGGLRYRPPLATSARTPVRLIDFRRGPRRTGPPRQTRSNGGVGVVLVIGLIIFGVLIFNIIAGIVEAISRLIP